MNMMELWIEELEVLRNKEFADIPLTDAEYERWDELRDMIAEGLTHEIDPYQNDTGGEQNG